MESIIMEYDTKVYVIYTIIYSLLGKQKKNKQKYGRKNKQKYGRKNR